MVATSFWNDSCWRARASTRVASSDTASVLLRSSSSSWATSSVEPATLRAAQPRYQACIFVAASCWVQAPVAIVTASSAWPAPCTGPAACCNRRESVDESNMGLFNLRAAQLRYHDWIFVAAWYACNCPVAITAEGHVSRIELALCACSCCNCCCSCSVDEGGHGKTWASSRSMFCSSLEQVCSSASSAGTDVPSLATALGISSLCNSSCCSSFATSIAASDTSSAELACKHTRANEE